jgi:hypothetical protein
LKITLHALSEECAEAVKRLHGIFTVVSVSGQYPDRGKSSLVRVYVEVRL